MSIETKKDIITTYLCSNKKSIEIRNGVILSDGNELKTSIPVTEDNMDEIARDESRKYYRESLKKVHFSNLVVLSGAGTSVKIGLSNDKSGGLTMASIWNNLNESNLVKLHTTDKSGKEEFGDFCVKCGYDLRDDQETIIKDLEALLDKANKVAHSDTSLLKEIEIIKKYVIKCCTLEIADDSPHRKLLRKVTKRKLKDSRVKVFTTNYDTLWEQAAAKDRFTIIDGFTYSHPRCFNGRFFDYDIVIRHRTRNKDEDSFIPKLFHLYKLHGSLGWREQGNEIVQTEVDLSDNKKELKDISLNGRLLVFPTNNKYECTYEAPYFEMMSRFQQCLRQENTLLITIGFSFLDKHITNVIEETLKQNPSLNLFVVDPSISVEKSNWKKLFAYTEIDNRTVLINDYFNDFADNYPENDSFEQQDLMSEFNQRLTTLMNGNSNHH
jgi:NAD-dependent SIR2 family protein deacetylase